MDQVQRLVCGVDFSEASARALRQALRIAEFSRASVTAVHVAAPWTSVIADPMFGMPSIPPVDLGDPVGEATRDWPEFLRRHHIEKDVPLTVVLGSPAAELSHSARESRADLIVIASASHRTGLGPVASAVARHARTKVLLVDPSYEGKFRHVIVGVDFSPISIRAIDAAIRIASLDSASLTLLHVFDPPWSGRVKADSPLQAPEMREQIRTAIVAQLKHASEAFAPQLAYLHARHEVIEGSPAGTMLTHAGLVGGADLIVIGTHGRSRLHDLLLGSTAERVLKHASCSILLVPQGR